MKSSQGFTLIELMIVVVIIAILAAVAIPSYQNAIQDTRRSDAREAVTRIAASQERYFFNNNRYGTLSELGLTTATGTMVQIESQEGFYNVRLNIAADAADRRAYTVQATATGAQMSDTECRSFFIDQVGRRTATDSNGDTTTEECW